MKDRLKEKLAELTEEYFIMLKNQGDLTGVKVLILFMTITIPQYIQSLYTKGYKAGFEDAKKSKGREAN